MSDSRLSEQAETWASPCMDTPLTLTRITSLCSRLHPAAGLDTLSAVARHMGHPREQSPRWKVSGILTPGGFSVPLVFKNELEFFLSKEGEIPLCPHTSATHTNLME